MFFKIPLLLGIIPVLISFLVRKTLSDRVVKREGGAEMSLNGRDLVERILKKGKAPSVEILVKRNPFVKLGPDCLLLSPAQAESRNALEVAEAALLAGMVLMARRESRVVGWRTWALKFGWAMPAFTTVVMAFAMVIGRLSPTWAIAVIAATLGLASILLWLTLPVEKEAARVVAEMLEETALIPRREDAERLAKLVRALSWRRVIPGAVSWIGGK